MTYLNPGDNFDETGQCIPSKELKSKVGPINDDFYFIQPAEIMRIRRIKKFLPEMEFLSEEDYEERTKNMIEHLKGSSVSDLLNGLFLPLPFPRFEIEDYGKNLEQYFLKALENSFREEFSDREFKNYREGKLEGNVDIVENSRHGKLLEAMAKGPLAGIMFFPMRGYSINASREQINHLPEVFLLSGAIDISIAFVGFPDVLARDFFTPAVNCAANSWKRSGGCSLYAMANDKRLNFSRTGSITQWNGCFSSAVLLLC